MTKHKNRSGGSNSDGPIDYSDHATQPAIPITDSEGSQTGWSSPDGSMKVSVNYGAARRRPSRPPDYTLQEHYESPTDQNNMPSPYEGPESFAPIGIMETGVPETMPLDLKNFADKPERPWESETPAPARDTPTASVDAQTPAAMGSDRPLGPGPSHSRPASAPSRHSHHRRAAPRRAASAPQRPARSRLEPPKPREDTGAFVADEYEQAALNRSWARVIVGLVVVGLMGMMFLLLLVFAFAGDRIVALFS